MLQLFVCVCLPEAFTIKAKLKDPFYAYLSPLLETKNPGIFYSVTRYIVLGIYLFCIILAFYSSIKRSVIKKNRTV